MALWFVTVGVWLGFLAQGFTLVVDAVLGVDDFVQGQLWKEEDSR